MELRPKLLIIGGAALCALLIAAANFAGLMLARVVERDGEIALRSALGATRGRLIRQGIVQALVLSAIGTVCGLLIAGWLTPALVALSPEGADSTGSAIREFDYGVRLDWPVFVFAAGAMLLVGVGFGMLPAWRASRADLRGPLASIGRGSTLGRGDTPFAWRSDCDRDRDCRCASHGQPNANAVFPKGGSPTMGLCYRATADLQRNVVRSPFRFRSGADAND